MSRKIWLTALAALGVSMAVGAAEFVRTTLSLAGGDDDVGYRVMSKSTNVRIGELLELPAKTRGRTLAIFCDLNENGEAEIEITVEIFGSGNFSIGCSAFGDPVSGAKKLPPIRVDCTALEVNGEPQIPGAGAKTVSFAKWHRISKDWKQTDKAIYNVKASFKKASAERAAEPTER